MTPDYAVSASQKVPISSPHAVTDAACAVVSTRYSSLACKYFIILFFIIVVLSVFLAMASHYFEAVNFQSAVASSVSADSDSTEVGSIHGKVAPHNLPDIPGPFIGRDKDVENVTHFLQFAENSHTKFVHIHGLPAVGKSTLAIHVGYEMAQHGIAVRYINVDEKDIFKSHEHSATESDDSSTSGLIKKFSDIQLSWYSHRKQRHVSTSPQGLIQWAKGLSNNTCLILDNCDHLLQINATQKEFREMLGELNIASRFLRIVSTSRLKVSLLAGFKLHKLEPLDDESAIELLQSLSDVMSLNHSRTVNGLVGGIPLALRIVGTLVNEIELPNLIIWELSENLIETLTPEDPSRLQTEKMRPVLDLSFKYLDTSTQECALYLSHFPGSFSHEAALHILSNCTNHSPVKCLTNLTDRSLLDQQPNAGQLHYKLHRLIKEYLMDVESQKLKIEVSRIALTFNSSFLMHYTQTLSDFVRVYKERPRDDENIGRFENESHNFDCLLDKVHFFHRWPVIPLVNLIRSLTCRLMLEAFTESKLLKIGQRSKVLLEHRMDDISTKIGASETLDVYRDLELHIRKWMRSYQGNCSALCKETFLQNMSSRFHIINKLLDRANRNKRDYYYELKFPYYKSSVESSCFSFCFQYDKAVIIGIGVVVLLNSVMRKTLGLCKDCTVISIGTVVLKLIIKVMTNLFIPITIPLMLWYYFYTDVLLALSVCIVVYVGDHLNSCLPKTMWSWVNILVSLLYYIVQYVLLTRKERLNYISICIVTLVIKLFSSRTAVILFPIFIAVFYFDAYVHDLYIIDVGKYLSCFPRATVAFYCIVQCVLLTRNDMIDMNYMVFSIVLMVFKSRASVIIVQILIIVCFIYAYTGELYIVDQVRSLVFYNLYPYYVNTFKEWHVIIICIVYCIIAYM